MLVFLLWQVIELSEAGSVSLVWNNVYFTVVNDFQGRDRVSWSDFNSWSDCLAVCGEGKRFRDRMCVDRDKSGYTSVHSSNCEGSNTEYQDCNVDKICPSKCSITFHWHNINRSAGKHDRRPYTHHIIYPLYYYTPFTVF